MTVSKRFWYMAAALFAIAAVAFTPLRWVVGAVGIGRGWDNLVGSALRCATGQDWHRHA